MEMKTDTARLMEQLEMAALDKEMAEEKVENVVLENENLQSKIQDLERELTLIKKTLERGTIEGNEGKELVRKFYKL